MPSSDKSQKTSQFNPSTGEPPVSGYAMNNKGSEPTDMQLREFCLKILEEQPDNELPNRTFNITTGKVEVTFGRMGRYATVSCVWYQYDNETLKRELRRCLESTGIHLIWVDIWCINQQEAADKTIEIPKVAQYYKQAALGLCLVPEVECLPGTWGFKESRKKGM